MIAHNRFTVGRFLQSLAIAKGDHHGAAAIAQGWGRHADREAVVTAHMAAVDPHDTNDFPAAMVPVADSFLAAMRPTSIPLQLAEHLRNVPMLTRVFVNDEGVIATQVAEGIAIPVLKGSWDTATLEPKKFAGITVQTSELVRSMKPAATLALTDDLAKATAEAENYAFLNPEMPDSVLYAAPSFSGGGSSLAQADADLRALVDLVEGASREGAAFVMTKETATALSLMRGTGGALAYPEITPQGGKLMGLPVLISAAAQQVGSPPTRIVALLSPSEIFWADEGRVFLSTSRVAALKMDNAATPDAGNLTSMFQADAVAFRAIRESSWYARSGAGAYFIAGF